MINTDLKSYKVWFLTGSQHLYGKETLLQVAQHSKEVAAHLDRVRPTAVEFKPVLTTSDDILSIIKQANSSDDCIGIICWMHTFSPAKMWVNGLKILNKPLLHLHTQYNTAIPWKTIDMDFMNLNQSAHGGREFGFMCSRLRMGRKVVVGHWQEKKTIDGIVGWIRVAIGWHTMSNLKVARLGDNMREVAVTEGDQVAAQMTFGFSVNGFGIGDLIAYIEEISAGAIDNLVNEYNDTYVMQDKLKATGAFYNSLRQAAQIELGLRAFLDKGEFTAFTNTFENLYGLKQLPGIAVQRLMADGYGFGAEGDWKTAALLRTMKAMSVGVDGGNSFMEDYTYHFSADGNKVLGSHMLEICPSIAKGDVRCEVHPLGIGGKEDPVRLVFSANEGPALNASLIDMGNRFRLIINEVNAQVIPHNLPNLPVARVLWEPMPDLTTAAQAWILAGGAHHTCYSDNVSTQQLEDLAEIAGIEALVIDSNTDIRTFKQDLRTNEVYYHLNKGF